MSGYTDDFVELYYKLWPKYPSLANACSVRAREQVPKGSNDGYDRQRSEHTNEFVRY
jgi:hypothetical protein